MRSLHRLAPLLTLVLLLALGVTTLSRPGPDEAEPYHAHVREVASAVPYRVGDWVGVDEALPREASELLRPNVLFSRRYEHRQTGEWATFLLVQCKDARDLDGHYPPICYPAHGWRQQEAERMETRVNGLVIPSTQYRFSYHQPEGTSRMVVNNFMILPDGRIMPDIGGVRRAASDYTSRFYGAAQVQLITSDRMSEERRQAVFERLVSANRDVIHAIRSGEAFDGEGR